MIEPSTAHAAAGASGSDGLVVFSRVDGVEQQLRGRTPQLPAESVRVLHTLDVPLILVSDGEAEDVRRLQRELRFTAPFICASGAALHVPPAYFDARSPDSNGTWEVFRFNPPNSASAVRMLCDLFVAAGQGRVLTVGVGRDRRDYGLLSAVDVPIIVRDDGVDQAMLLREIPGAYLTSATGGQGWSEALIGEPAR